MRKINPAHIETLIELINKGPYFELLSMKTLDMSIGYAKIEIEVQDKLMNPFGGIHGGVYSSLIDTATYCAVYCEMDEDTGYTTIDLNVNNLGMLKQGKIIVEGRTIKTGKSLCIAEATAKDEGGKILAYGSSKLMILKNRQSISHAVDNMGYSELPPKFID